MDITSIIALTIFVVGYIFITLEHRVGTHKSAIALALGGLLWIIVAFSGLERKMLAHSLEEAGVEIFQIVAFLLAAMALVEILIHYHFFDLIRIKLNKLRLNDRKQLVVIGVLTFFLSAILDNLTVTIVMIQIARRFFQDKNLLVAAATIVIMANAGGAWSPIGDVTTIMLWLAHKFSAWEVIRMGFLPAVVLGAVSLFLMLRQIQNNTKDIMKELPLKLSRGEKGVIILCLGSFTLPLTMNFLGLPPYLGLLMGLGLVWLFIEYAKLRSARETHLEANIDALLQHTDIASLKFFIGILLSVSALQALGILEKISIVLLGEHQEATRVIAGNVVLGLLSAIVDNVPLTALAIDMIKIPDPDLWVLLAISVGTGGSFLVIGSVAGVIAMGMIKQLTFGKYLKIASIPALVGYFAGIGVWLTQYNIFK